jgi:XTP/dITP diphosphohydrolase
MTTLTVLLASTNLGKLKEIQDILYDIPLQLTLPTHSGIHLYVEETGDSYAENAVLKAKAYSQASGMVALADDSGLEVEALDNAPGLYSARYAPIANATDADRRRHLLDNLRDIPQPWPARFHCTCAICTPGGEVHTFSGEVAGEIIAEERGSGGFGYDPVFYLPAYGLTMAELPEGEKNRISHRALAVRAAVPYLLELIAASKID